MGVPIFLSLPDRWCDLRDWYPRMFVLSPSVFWFRPFLSLTTCHPDVLPTRYTIPHNHYGASSRTFGQADLNGSYWPSARTSTADLLLLGPQIIQCSSCCLPILALRFPGLRDSGETVTKAPHPPTTECSRIERRRDAEALRRCRPHAHAGDARQTRARHTRGLGRAIEAVVPLRSSCVCDHQWNENCHHQQPTNLPLRYDCHALQTHLEATYQRPQRDGGKRPLVENLASYKLRPCIVIRRYIARDRPRPDDPDLRLARRL